MKIGRTNAQVIIQSGGETKSDYELWQEGFNKNWDDAVANAPLADTNRILHVYTEVDFLQMASAFPTTADIVAYNPVTEAYRRLTLSASKLLTLQESDKFVNSHDGLKYVCVIYSNSSWGSTYFGIQLPVVYSNSKAVTSDGFDQLVSLFYGESSQYTPLLRGVDCNSIKYLSINTGVEHISCLQYDANIVIHFIQGGNLQVAVLKKLIDEMPTGTSVSFNVQGAYVIPYVTDEKLANWLYNYFYYTYLTGTYYFLPASNITRLFKFNSNLILTVSSAATSRNYINAIPNAMYLTGTITEDQTATTYAGYHGFYLAAYTLLRNFPMWTVLDPVSTYTVIHPVTSVPVVLTTGCLKPMQTINARGNFDFYSTNLERDYFAKFDTNGNLILDPTLSFVANLPVQTLNGASIRFRDLTFKNKFSTAEQNKIIELVTTLKRWSLVW